MQRVYNWKIAKAIKAGELPPARVVNGQSEWYKCKWIFPEFGWIDPTSEADVAVKEWNMGVTSLSSVCGKKGRDSEDVLREKGGDIQLAAKIAKEVSASTGVQVNWQDIISTMMPGQGVQASQIEKTKQEQVQ